MSKTERFDTRAIHAGELRPRPFGAAVLPIFQCTVFEQPAGTGADETVVADEVRYPRLSNLPSHRVLGAKIADLEGTEDAVVTASGMAAISTALLALLRSGDHLLAIDNVYGGTFALLRDLLPDLGIEVTLVDAHDREAWQRALRPNTRALWSEAITNPLVRVPDHRGLVEFARAHDLVTAIDATFAPPCNFRPAAIGYDLVVHSATKYLNGHSDVTAGAVAGGAEQLRRVRARLDVLGGCLDPNTCFLLHRGLRTLGLRVERHNENALGLARALTEMRGVRSVRYPGLPDHPDHARASELFTNGSGGMLAFELDGGPAAVDRFFRKIRLATCGPSLGGVETLVTSPRRTSHASLDDDERARMGISDALVRVSVGIEHVADLIDDFAQATA